MKFNISTALLQTVSNKLVKAVSMKDTVPSLRCFFIVANKDLRMVRITAGDGAVYLEKDMEGIEIEEAGEVLVDGRDFTKLIGKITVENIILSFKDNKVEVRAGKSKFVLKTQDPKNYVFPEDVRFDIEGVSLVLPEFKNALKLAAITTSKNATEIYYTGFMVGPEIMSTNRNNTTIYDMPLVGDHLLFNPDFVKIIWDLDGDTAKMSYTEDFVEITTPGTRVLGNLLAGQEHFLPAEEYDEAFNHENSATVSKKDLLPILDRAMVFMEKTGAINMKFREDGVVECVLVGVLETDTYEEMRYVGSLTMSVNASLGMLFEICSAIENEDDTIQIKLTADEGAPMLIVSDKYRAYLAMMNVN